MSDPLPQDGPGSPIPGDEDYEDRCCANCAAPHATWRCPEIRALLFAPATLDRIFTNVMERLAHPHPCGSCGDMTCADICAACSEDRAVDIYGISLTLRASCKATAAERAIVDGVRSVF